MRPWHVLAPHPAVGAEDGAEGAELEPASIELARLRHRMEEAAHVGAPVRHAGQARVEPQRDLRVERLEVVVDIARPARRPESLHPRRPRAAEQEDTLVGPVGRLSDGECLVAEPVVILWRSVPSPAWSFAVAGGPSPPSSHQPATPSLASSRWAAHHQAPTAGLEKSR